MKAIFKQYEAIFITLGLALLVLIFTKWDPQIMTFVSLFLLLEAVFLGITYLRQRKKQ